jgi:hypothetical protein
MTGGLLRSVAIEKAHIKEHNVDLLFEEWQPEEEGFSLPRVWIRIFRLPSRLREFSVLWALGSMLGATQSIDMVTSLKKNYGRVEVAVLNVDLLPKLIDTVVIGDRLYSLPIQVEGREENVETGTQMDVDDGADNKETGADKSSGKQDQDSSSNRGKEKGEGSGQQKSQSNGTKQNNGATKEQSVGTVASHGVVAYGLFTLGQQKMSGNVAVQGGVTISNGQNESGQDLSVSKLHASVLNGIESSDKPQSKFL